MKKQNNKTEKLTDKAFSRFVFMSILTIVLCIFGLCGATYAWYTTSSYNNNNVINAGNFELDITIANSSGEEVEMTKISDGTHSAILSTASDYTVTLRVSDRTTVSRGYCLITIGGRIYSTDTMRRSEKESYTFTVTTDRDNVKILFDPNWSAATSVEVENGGSLLITPSNNINPDTDYDN